MASHPAVAAAVFLMSKPDGFTRSRQSCTGRDEQVADIVRAGGQFRLERSSLEKPETNTVA